MKRLHYIFITFATLNILVSCSQYHRETGRAYAPDMTYSKAVDFYNDTTKINAAGGTYNKMPAVGTIAREQAMPDHITEADSLKCKTLTCPIDITEKDLEEGKRAYLIYCGVCHGQQLDGNGPLYSSGKFAAMPANLKLEKFLNMSVGTMYYTILFGKNAMGSYVSQLDTKQRWQVIAYIKKVQSENGGSPFTMQTKSSVKDTTIIKK